MEKRTRDRSQGMQGKRDDQHAHPDRDSGSQTLMFKSLEEKSSRPRPSDPADPGLQARRESVTKVGGGRLGCKQRGEDRTRPEPPVRRSPTDRVKTSTEPLNHVGGRDHNPRELRVSEPRVEYKLARDLKPPRRPIIRSGFQSTNAAHSPYISTRSIAPYRH
jgi:hypothetical protein